MIPKQKVKVRWHPSNKKYYISKNYQFTKLGDTFEVDIKDLKEGSHEIVKCICDYCGTLHYKEYRTIFRYRKNINKDCCDNTECKSKKSKEIDINKKN